MSLVFAAIAPHGGIAVPEAVAPEVAGRAAATTAGLEELGRRFDASAAETAVVLTPHNVHVEGHLAVPVAGRLAGALDGARQPVRLDLEVDRELALACLAELRRSGLPALAVSFGGNDTATAVMPLDWATLIPLWFMGGRRPAPPAVVVVSPARDLPPEAHVEAGRALARAIAGSPRRVAAVASADHGHTHQAPGPYGFDPAAAECDAVVQRCLRENDLGALTGLDRALVDAARADSWWQLLLLHGLLGEGARAEVLAYEVPTYFGMLCAELHFSTR